MTTVLFESVTIRENDEPLVDLAGFDFVLAPMYFNQELSSTSKMFLREGVAKKLTTIQKSLNGYRFKIWDGYRSREVQNNIYQQFLTKLRTEHPAWDEKKLETEVGTFVTAATNPSRIPPHATGGAVDLTLVDKNGNELAMGTPFDFFGKEAAPYYFDTIATAKEIAANRKLLRDAMESHDFRQDADEWWHYDYGNQIWALQRYKPFAVYGEITNEHKALV